jgi:hypothetical protein
MTTLRGVVLAYLKQVGPSICDAVTRDTGMPRHKVAKALCDLVKDGTAAKREGRPVVYSYVRDPMPMAERAIRATLAAEAYRATVRLTPEQKKAKRSALSKSYYERHKTRLIERKAERRREASRLAPPKPKPSRRLKEDAAFTPAAVKLSPVDKSALPDTEAWLAANADRLVRLEPGASSQPRDKLTAAQRRMVLGFEVAA